MRAGNCRPTKQQGYLDGEKPARDTAIPFVAALGKKRKLEYSTGRNCMQTSGQDVKSPISTLTLEPPPPDPKESLLGIRRFKQAAK